MGKSTPDWVVEEGVSKVKIRKNIPHSQGHKHKDAKAGTSSTCIRTQEMHVSWAMLVV